MPSTTIGLNNRFPGPAVYVQATSSLLTLVLLTCLSEEYCEESAEPKYWRQVSNGRSAPCASPASEIDNPTKTDPKTKACFNLYTSRIAILSLSLWELLTHGFAWIGIVSLPSNGKAKSRLFGVPRAKHRNILPAVMHVRNRRRVLTVQINRS